MDFCTSCVNEYAWRPTDNPFPKECKECEVVDGKPSNFKPKNKTNADRIRAMSDEELAELLHSIIHERDVTMIEKLKKQGIEASLVEAPVLSVKAHLEWLKQPAEEVRPMVDTCICCGEIVPEGRMVCPNCENGGENNEQRN